MQRVAILLVVAALGSPCAQAQFLDDPVAAGAGPRIEEMRTQRYRVGVVVTGVSGGCRDIYATMAVPNEWPEQKVRVVGEDTTPGVKLSYRTLENNVKQMVVQIPTLAAGARAQAIVTFELDRAAIAAPEETAGLRVPAKPDRSLHQFLGPSPYVEIRNPRIMKFAKEAAADHEGWGKVEAIYDAVRARVEYRNGDLKGAARALADGWGDCEELTCLFIAACRVVGIPARTVWVEGHCYPEFWLEDEQGMGHWYPCQAAGTRAFGSMPDQLPILQKGDNFRDPDRPGRTLRYVEEFLRGTPLPGAAPPQIEWIREGA